MKVSSSGCVCRQIGLILIYIFYILTDIGSRIIIITPVFHEQSRLFFKSTRRGLRSSYVKYMDIYARFQSRLLLASLLLCRLHTIHKHQHHDYRLYKQRECISAGRYKIPVVVYLLCVYRVSRERGAGRRDLIWDGIRCTGLFLIVHVLFYHMGRRNRSYQRRVKWDPCCSVWFM